MYTYTATRLFNVRESTTRTPKEDIRVIAFNSKSITGSFSDSNGAPATQILNGDFTNTSTPPTFADIQGTAFSLENYDTDGLLTLKKTWSDGVDVQTHLLGFAYELAELSGDDEFEGYSTLQSNDLVQGMTGNDRFKGYGNTNKYGDVFFGGDGIDTSIYQGKISDYVIIKSGTELRSFDVYDHRTVAYADRVGEGKRVSGFFIEDNVVNRDDTDAVVEVERLEFEVAESNGANRVALDLDGNAGNAAKLLGALWGKESVQNSAYVGIVLHFLDSGTSYEDLLDLALGALLGPNKTNNDVAELVYRNLIGEAPTEAVTKELASYMDSGAYSQAAFTRAVADLEINATNIDLVGLANTGLQYVEYVA